MITGPILITRWIPGQRCCSCGACDVHVEERTHSCGYCWAKYLMIECRKQKLRETAKQLLGSVRVYEAGARSRDIIFEIRSKLENFNKI